MRQRTTPRSWALLMLLGLAGCSVAKGVVEMPGKAIGVSKDDPAAALIDMQQKLLRFTDSFQSGLAASLERIRRDGKDVDSKTALQWKLILSTSAISIASGANPRLNLLDMSVFVILVRKAVETRWQPGAIGPAAQALHDTCQNADEDIDRLAASILKPEELKGLREAVEEWHRAHPQPEEILTARTAGFALDVVEKSRKDASKSDGMFSFLSLDPMSTLDPAVREITQTRLLAERALFVAERLPNILRWQAELLSMTMLDLPAVQKLTGATTQVSASVERITAVAEKLPDRLVKEREELVRTLETQEKTLAPMVKDVRQTVEAGTAMSESVNGMLKTLDGLVKRLTDAGILGGPPSPNAEPFRIQDYIKAANQLEATTKQLTEAISAADRLIGSEGVRKLPEQVAPVVTRAETGAREIVDYAFTRALVLVGVVLAAALAYRFVSLRMSAASRPKA